MMLLYRGIASVQSVTHIQVNNMSEINTGGASLSEVVLQKVAEREEVPPSELNPPLYDVIDPEALDSVFRGSTGHISFEYHGYAVTVDCSGNVSFGPREAD